MKYLHAQRDAPAHNDSVARICAAGKSSQAWTGPAISAVSIKCSTRSSTPLNWVLSAVVNSCLIPLDLHRSQSFPWRNAPPPSNRTKHQLGRDTISASICKELLRVFRGVRFVTEKVQPRIPRIVIAHYETVHIPPDRLISLNVPRPPKPSVVFLCA